MEALAYTQLCSSYEQSQGIEYALPEFDLSFKKLPSSAWMGTAAIAVMAAAFSAAAPAHAARVNTPSGRCLNARTGPGTGYAAQKCVRDGAALLPVVARQGSWLKLSSGRWVYGPYTTAGGGSSGGGGGNTGSGSGSTALLRRGTRGSKVKTVQQQLAKFGYAIGGTGADGIYGTNTIRAVRSFQAQNGLGVDGIVGPQTLQAMGL